MNETEGNLGRLLFNIRKAKGLSLRAFSEVIGMSHAYLDKLEKGTDLRTGKEIAPTVEMVAKIAERLEIPKRRFYEMCGYLSEEGISLAEPPSKKNFDIAVELEMFKMELETSRQVSFKNAQLSTTQVKKVLDLLNTIYDKLNK